MYIAKELLYMLLLEKIRNTAVSQTKCSAHSYITAGICRDYGS